ncbi:MAG: site-specific integrase [Bacillota bacterium]|nr:site-specific integrase [Bacillota bacterium]
MDENVSKFLTAIKGNEFERFFIVALFSGLRQSELIGLQWDDVDFENRALTVRRQIQKDHDGPGYHFLEETKNGKQRTAAIAPSIVRVLKSQRAQQAEWRLAAGPLWANDRNLVFTDPLGNHLKHRTINNHFKKIVASIGLPDTRFHDLRHSYAVNALQAGDSVKDVQEQLGHYSSAFTMDTYAAVSETMRKASQARMEALIKSVSDL